jgi:thioesterase domain-containing protein
MAVYHTEVEAMASDYVEAIRGFQPVGPYWLAGWSMGGVIAFEMARQLQQQGQEIGMLALIDTGVPEAKESEYNWAVLLWIFALDLGFPREFVDRGTAWVPKPQMVELRNLWSEAR